MHLVVAVVVLSSFRDVVVDLQEVLLFRAEEEAFGGNTSCEDDEMEEDRGQIASDCFQPYQAQIK